jgi:hypothetical protein
VLLGALFSYAGAPQRAKKVVRYDRHTVAELLEAWRAVGGTVG